MAHEIQKFGYVGEKAWHGLGEQLPEGLTAEEAFRKLGIDWGTRLAPIHATVGDKQVPLDGFRAHIREDNHDVLGVVTDGYKPIENMDVARFADLLAGDDAAVSVETAGTLMKGRRVFALVKLPEVIRVTAEDIVDLYMLVSNGHGGFASFSAYPTSVRVVCANTLRWSEADAGKGVTFRHQGDIDGKIKIARAAMGLAQAETLRFREAVAKLVKTQMDAATARAFMEIAWDRAFGIKISPESENYEKLRDKRSKEIERWMELFESPNQTLPGISGTAWAAYNAASEWIEHEKGRFEDGSPARNHSNLFGVSQVQKLRIFRAALGVS
jgi:phage/plasmid-like protein (TIGR03299 family)